MKTNNILILIIYKIKQRKIKLLNMYTYTLIFMHKICKIGTNYVLN